jgi:PilZ domain
VYGTAEAELRAFSQAPGVIGEEMSLVLAASVGSITLRVQVLDSRPVIIDGALHHRVRLGILWETASDMENDLRRPDGWNREEVMATVGALLQANDVVGIVGRHVPVRLIDISTSGCLFESWVRLDVGTHITVRVAHDGREFTDDVRVARSQPKAGSSGVFQVGAEFLWTKTPTERSMRTIVAQYDGASLQQPLREARQLLLQPRHQGI